MSSSRLNKSKSVGAIPTSPINLLIIERNKMMQADKAIKDCDDRKKSDELRSPIPVYREEDRALYQSAVGSCSL